MGRLAYGDHIIKIIAYFVGLLGLQQCFVILTIPLDGVVMEIQMPFVKNQEPALSAQVD